MRWQFPHFLSEEEKAERKKKEDARPRWPEGANEELSGKFFGTLERFRNQLVDAENMYGEFGYIVVIHVCVTVC